MIVRIERREKMVSRKIREKGDEKFFTNLEKYGNIKPDFKLQF